MSNVVESCRLVYEESVNLNMLIMCVITEIRIKLFPIRNYLVHLNEICCLVFTRLNEFNSGRFHAVQPILHVKLKCNFQKIFSERLMRKKCCKVITKYGCH